MPASFVHGVYTHGHVVCGMFFINRCNAHAQVEIVSADDQKLGDCVTLSYAWDQVCVRREIGRGGL